MQKPSASSLIPVLIIVFIITGGLYFLFKPQDDSIRQTTNSLPNPVEQVNPTGEDSSKQTTEKEIAPASYPYATDTGQYRRAPMEATTTDPCLEAIKQLDGFFLYLDSQDYIQAYQFPNGSKDFVASIINKALVHPPNPKTTKSIVNQAKTGAHLYRTIGAQNLLILAKILVNEPDQLENVFTNFYNWSLMAGQCPNRTYAIRPQLDQLYSYALFFIDSEDGKNYVKRRDSMTGLLTRLYAVQIIKEAQTHHIDKYNIDLTTHITSLITDIESTDLLEKKTTYLKTLYAFRDEE